MSRHDIVFTATAAQDLVKLRAVDRAAVEDAIEVHLRYQPEKTSKSRIKRLRGLSSPQYRLRVEDHRVFYDVDYRVDRERGTVIILAIRHKSAVAKWLAANEVRDETGAAE